MNPYRRLPVLQKPLRAVPADEIRASPQQQSNIAGGRGARRPI